MSHLSEGDAPFSTVPLIQIQLDQMFIPKPSLKQVEPELEKFLTDMEKDVSYFFNLPKNPTWKQEWKALEPKLPTLSSFDTVFNLGIGGSSLGTEALIQALQTHPTPKFFFFDNIDPDWTEQVLKTSDPQKTLVYVVTKSGTTMETLAQFAKIYEWLEKNLGKDQARQHLVFCTDPSSGALRELSKTWEIPTFDIPTNLGGRFSVLCPVGLFPALLAKIDIESLLKGALEYRTYFLNEVQAGKIPQVVELAYQLIQHGTQNQKNMTVFMPYSQKLKALGFWFAQLWGESLGKDQKGLTPITAIGATDQHSLLQLLRDGPQDKVVGFLEILEFQNPLPLQWRGPKNPAFDLISGITMQDLILAEFQATKDVLIRQKRPCFTIVLPKLEAHYLGQILFFFEILTSLAGYYLNVDPYNQPGVDEGKLLTQQLLSRIRLAKSSP